MPINEKGTSSIRDRLYHFAPMASQPPHRGRIPLILRCPVVVVPILSGSNGTFAASPQSDPENAALSTDALASLPGLYTSYDRTYSYLGARGFRRPGDYNSRFLLLIDCMRINDSVFDQASIGTDFPLDLDLVERIEYVPGPGSAVYGSNAIFGVINVVTRKGEALGGPQTAASVGSFGEKRARF